MSTHSTFSDADKRAILRQAIADKPAMGTVLVQATCLLQALGDLAGRHFSELNLPARAAHAKASLAKHLAELRKRKTALAEQSRLGFSVGAQLVQINQEIAAAEAGRYQPAPLVRVRVQALRDALDAADQAAAADAEKNPKPPKK